MKIKLIATLTLLMIFISACGGQAPQATPEPATATETSVPPTNTPLPTDTLVPPSTDTATALPATEAPAAATGVSYANDVSPIFDANCNKCHGIEQVKEGLDMTTYNSLMVGSFNGVVIVPGNATDSFLVQQIVEGEMPKRGPKLTAQQTQILADWIDQGALNN